MTVSDVAGQELPEDDALAQRGWWPGGPLTRLEQDMLRKAEAGELLDLGKGPFKLAEMKEWGRSRTIRAGVLQHLLVSQTGRVHAKGVRLRGVRISGRLDLESTILRCPLRLEDCYFSNRRSVKLDYATVSLLTFTRCHLPGLTGDTLVVNEDFQLDGSTCTGPVQLPDADIGGVLSFRGTHLEASHRLYALAAFRMKVGGGVFLDGIIAAGAVRLSDVSITGHLSCGGAALKGIDTGGNVLLGDGIKVGGNVFLDEIIAAGAVWLTDASITGYLSCSRAKLNAADGNGRPASHSYALAAWRMKVGGGAYLNGKFTAAGTVSLAGVDITGDLNCSGAALSGVDGGYALDGYEMKVAGDVILEEKFTATAPLQLVAADIAGSLRCSGARLVGADRAGDGDGDGDALSADRIKVGGSVYLNKGFTAVGAVRLVGADITGQLNCSDARLVGTDSDGYALLGDLMKVGGAVLLCEEFTAAGTVRLVDANITGQVNCSGALLTGAGPDGALHADGIKVGSSVILNGVTAAGAIRLRSADITGQLSCDGAVMAGADTGGKTLNVGGMKVSGDVFLRSGFTAAGTVWLVGADIKGQLNCSGGALLARAQGGTNALVAEQIKIGGSVILDGVTAAGAIRLRSADITGQLSCIGAQLTGADDAGYALLADGVKVSGDVFLNGRFTATGGVRLPGADITGQLSCSGAQLTGADHAGYALIAEGIKVGGHVSLEGVTAAGTVRLFGADITGQVNCSGAVLVGADGDGTALLADGMKVGGHVFLDGVTAAGTVRLFGADITGQVSCSGTVLTGADGGGTALLADGMKVGGDVILDEEGIANGTVSLISARVDGSLVLMPTKLADRNGITALDATGAQIGHKLVWQPTEQVSGLVILEDATVGQVDDSWGPAADGRPNGYWPLACQGLLRLDGFTYTRIGGKQPAKLEDRLRWIGSQPRAPWKKRAVSVMREPWTEIKNRRHRRLARATYGFAPQPYEQLAQVYQQTGHPTEARAVALARRRDLRLYGHPTPYRRALDWLLDKTIKYGYQTWRAVLGIAVLYAAVLALFWYAQHQPGLIVPVQSIQGLQPKPTAASCASNYPCFSPVGYAIDTVIPLINVHQADYWGPNANAPFGWFFVWVSWAGIVLGWLLATLAVAGYTGLVRNTD